MARQCGKATAHSTSMSGSALDRLYGSWESDEMEDHDRDEGRESATGVHCDAVEEPPVSEETEYHPTGEDGEPGAGMRSKEGGYNLQSLAVHVNYGLIGPRRRKHEANECDEDAESRLDSCPDSKTSPTEFPTVVAVGDETGYWASGVVVLEDHPDNPDPASYVLIAGHVHSLGGRCWVSTLKKLPGALLCKKTATDYKPGSGGQGEFAVLESVRHPRFWDAPFYRHDIALLKVEHLGVLGGANEQDGATSGPRTILTAEWDQFREEPCGLMVGYGSGHDRGADGADDDYADEHPDQHHQERYGKRRCVDIPIIHERYLALDRWFDEVWGYQRRFEFVAADAIDQIRDACTGDSGGGFFIRVGDKWKLAGMVSRQFGLGGASCGAGTIYVNLFRSKPGQRAPSNYWACIHAMKEYLDDKSTPGAMPGAREKLEKACRRRKRDRKRRQPVPDGFAAARPDWELNTPWGWPIIQSRR